MSERTYWAFGNSEQLFYNDPDEFIEESLDGYLYDEIQKIIKDNEVWVIHEWKPLFVNLKHVSMASPLENLLICLDEEYGDPEGPPTKPSKEMIEAEKKFINEIVSHYHVWSCEKTGNKIEVNVSQWIKENNYDIEG